MQGIPYLKLAAATIVLTVISSVLMTIPDWNGIQASAEADDIDTLLDVAIILSSFVFSLVMVLLGYSLFRWRARPGDESDGEPIHGNTRLEIIWTVIPTVIVLILGAYSWIVLDDIEAKDPDAMEIEVTGQQFAWSFDYPEANKTSTELHVPVGQQLELQMRALDVLHSFWVPEWRVKRDLVPGAPCCSIDDTVVVTPDRVGTYSLVCTEFCGIGHSTMRGTVVVHEQEDFDAWLADQPEIPAESPESGGEPQDSPVS
jgi:cytochrome c oxidase subunit II